MPNHGMPPKEDLRYYTIGGDNINRKV